MAKISDLKVTIEVDAEAMKSFIAIVAERCLVTGCPGGADSCFYCGRNWIEEEEHEDNCPHIVAKRLVADGVKFYPKAEEHFEYCQWEPGSEAFEDSAGGMLPFLGPIKIR